MNVRLNSLDIHCNGYSQIFFENLLTNQSFGVEIVFLITISTNYNHYEKSQEQKKPEFLEKYKKRSAQKWKKGEMKRFHGLSRARGWGLRSILFQAKLTAIAVNLKRIAAITGKETLPVIAFLRKLKNISKHLF